MTKPLNQWEQRARDAAERLDAAQAAGQQLSLLPPDPAEALEPGKGRGRARASSQLRQWLEVQGYRAPEEVLAEMAGLASNLDAFTTAMVRVQQLEQFAGGMKPEARLSAFMQLYSAQLRAAEALLPYVAGKVDKPAPPPLAVQVVMGQPQAPARGGDGARVVNPAGDRAAPGARMAPPPMPWESKQNQGVEE